MATPVFDGASENDVYKMLELAGLDKTGQINLIDGRTGEQFDRKVTVGYIYMLSYIILLMIKYMPDLLAILRQQPLGGKAIWWAEIW